MKNFQFISKCYFLQWNDISYYNTRTTRLMITTGPLNTYCPDNH